MYLSYFDKFYDMEPYLEIDEKEWEYIKTTFDKEDVKESKKGEVDYKKVMQKASEELGTTEFSDQKINEIAEKLVNEKS